MSFEIKKIYTNNPYVDEMVYYYNFDAKYKNVLLTKKFHVEHNLLHNKIIK